VIVVDANVLLYAVNESSAHHRRARAWLDGALNGQETLGFSWTVLLAFLRLSTHPRVFPRPLAIPDAAAIVRDWLAQTVAVAVHPTPRHIDVLAGLLSESGAFGNLVNDAHLAALAIEHNAVLISFDTDFARFGGLRWEQPPAN
jgi:toxin-antitoxin system PIN domain toxin